MILEGRLFVFLLVPPPNTICKNEDHGNHEEDSDFVNFLSTI